VHGDSRRAGTLPVKLRSASEHRPGAAGKPVSSRWPEPLSSMAAGCAPDLSSGIGYVLWPTGEEA